MKQAEDDIATIDARASESVTVVESLRKTDFSKQVTPQQIHEKISQIETALVVIRDICSTYKTMEE